jgi:hypothetical protein
MSASTPSIEAQYGAVCGLLQRAREIVEREARALVECDSRHQRNAAGELEPVPGTLSPGTDTHVSPYVGLLREIDAFFELDEPQHPDWFDDLLARRNGWEDGV